MTNRSVLADVGFAVLAASVMMTVLGLFPVLGGLLGGGLTGAMDAYHGTFQFLFSGQTLATTTVAFVFLLDRFLPRKRALALSVFMPSTVAGLLSGFSLFSSFVVLFAVFLATVTLLTWEQVNGRFENADVSTTGLDDSLATDGGDER